MRVFLILALCSSLLWTTAPLHAQQGDPQREWRKRISATLETQRIYPFSGEDGSANVGFIIDRSGDLKSVQIVESSGSKKLDAAAVEIVQRAQPFPAAPPELAAESFDFTVRLNFVRHPPRKVQDQIIEKGETSVNAKIHGICRGC